MRNHDLMFLSLHMPSSSLARFRIANAALHCSRKGNIGIGRPYMDGRISLHLIVKPTLQEQKLETWPVIKNVGLQFFLHQTSH